MISHRIRLGLLLSVAVSATFAASVPVYKWTDAEGVTHYAETPPADRGAAAVRLDVDTVAAPEEKQTDYHAILEQANDLRQARLQREQQREAQRRAELQAEMSQAAAEPEQEQSTQPVYVPIYVHRHRGDRDAHAPGSKRPPSARRRGDRDPAFDPPQQWLRSHPRLLQKELRARRDSEPAVRMDRATKRH